MEKGSLRCDGNISLKKRGSDKLGVKTELKNINSFKSLHDGLMYEILRQAEALENGEQILQETRHWDPSAKRTIVMRVKETADDYRLFPEPDLAPYDLSDEFIENVRKKLPELPDAKAKRYEKDFGLSSYDAWHIVDRIETALLFEQTLELANNPSKEFAKNLANLIINDLTAWLNADENNSLDDCGLNAKRLNEVVELACSEKISKSQQKKVFEIVIKEDLDPTDVVKREGMEQVSDEGEIEAIVDKILTDFPDKVEEYKGGKTGLIGFFVGQCMKAMNGKGNPKMINELLAKKLN